MDLALRDQRIKRLRDVKRGIINDLHRTHHNTEMNDSLIHATDNLLNYLNTQYGGGGSSDSDKHVQNKIECAINHIYNTLDGEI